MCPFCFLELPTYGYGYDDKRLNHWLYTIIVKYSFGEDGNRGPMFPFLKYMMVAFEFFFLSDLSLS